MVKKREEENLLGKMDQYMKVNGKMTCPMVWED